VEAFKVLFGTFAARETPKEETVRPNVNAIATATRALFILIPVIIVSTYYLCQVMTGQIKQVAHNLIRISR
jgi:hypothetical protein